METAEKTNEELKNRSIDIIQPEKQREKRLKAKAEPQWSVRQYQVIKNHKAKIHFHALLGH